jgi:hypothetical protein
MRLMPQYPARVEFPLRLAIPERLTRVTVIFGCGIDIKRRRIARSGTRAVYFTRST